MTMRVDAAPVAVLGAGNWGTTVALLAVAAGRNVMLWTRDGAQAAEINDTRRNAKYCGNTPIPAGIVATTSLADAVRGAGLVLVIIPSKAFRSVARELGALLTPDQYVVHGTKGLEAGTHKRMSELLLEETCARQVGVLGGPNIANEILAGTPAGTVAASRFPRVVDEVRAALGSTRFRIFGSSDVAGVEYAGSFKNVVAIAAGVAHAMGLGENMNAMLVTRGLSEIATVGTRLGAQPETFFGLAGIGDLVVTCASHHSRNHRLGVALAKGATLQQAITSLGQVAEGVNTAKALHEMDRGDGAQPLFDRVYRVLYEDLKPSAAVAELMSVPTGSDVSRAFRE